MKYYITPSIDWWDASSTDILTASELAFEENGLGDSIGWPGSDISSK